MDGKHRSGELGGALCQEYTRRKAQMLFDDGGVAEAAELGHSEAQGLMAQG